MQRICVFAGSNEGVRQEYRQAAYDLGQAMVARGLGLVYGGASIGLMGIVANAVMAAGGEAIGVLPRGLFKHEVAHQNLTKLHQVNSMHERKALMADLSDGFIALPGGFGTFDELFEITTWAQIGLHSKPIGLLNVTNYFTPLLALVAHAAKEGFILPFHTNLLLHNDSPNDLLEAITTFTPLESQLKWLEPPIER